MPRNSELQRFSELLQAFVHLSRRRDDVQLRGSSMPPPLGFAVRLQPAPLAPAVEIALSLENATLRTWSADGAGPGESERPLRVDLSEGFRYDCLLFPDAESLAVTLVRRMDDELAHGVGQA